MRWLPIHHGLVSLAQFALVGAYALLMFIVCMIACAVPTWRALRVQPIEIMRAEA